MADIKELTQADIDAAVEKAIAPFKESVEKLDAKNKELIGENRKLKSAGEIKPEDLAAAEDRADKAEAALADAGKQVKTISAERDKAVKALETESGASRNALLERDISAAIATGSVVPAYVPQYTAWLKTQDAKAEIVDGKLVTTIAGKPVTEFVTAHLSSEAGLAFKAAPINGGGGATGSNTNTGGGKSVARTVFNAMDQVERGTFVSSGGKVVDA